MCGIVGISAKTNNDYSDTIRALLSKIKHRGPESEGVFQKGTVWLGHRRLKIIDISDRSNQPLVTTCGRYTISYNGEIYNHHELRDELIGLGHQFVTTSDTEVILLAYKQWGSDCVERFNGIWAFAIFDAESNQLFISRDRFGVKPLYYIETSECYAFASEIKALLPLLKQVKASAKRVASFLVYGECEDAESTFFADIHKLPGGCNLRYNTATQQATITTYYDIKSQPLDVDPQEALAKAKALLQSSIDYQRVADVPVAVSLSGGLDSSVITKLVLDHSTAPFTAFTAISEDSNNSELPYAEKVADDTKIDWVKITPNYDDVVRELPNVVHAQEEPFSTPSIIMQYFLMKRVHESGIKVVLDGQGADEVFLGYERYIVLEVLRLLRTSQAISSFSDLRLCLANNDKLSIKRLAYYTAGSLFPKLRQRYMNMRAKYLNTKGIQKPDYLYHYAMSSKRSCFELQKLELMATNLPALLRFADKNSMAFSVEDRVPYLDHRLVELCLSLPQNVKLRHGWTKWLLRAMFDKQLPDSIIWRKNKIAYEAPERIWLKQLRPAMYAAVMESPLLDDYCDKGKLTKQGHKVDDRQLWRLYSVALWEKEFLSNA